MRQEPKPGDEVLYHPLPYSHLRQHDKKVPLSGKVVFVQDYDLVNLVVWDHAGNSHALTSIKLWHPGDLPEEMRPVDDYCVSKHAPEGARYNGPNDRALREAQFKREPVVQGTRSTGAGVVAKVTEQLNPDIEHVKRAGIDDVESKAGSAPRQES